MKEFNLKEFNKKIEKNRPKITKTILQNNQIGKINAKKRSEDEIRILNIITKSRWEKAITQGKVKRISKNVYNYYFD